MKIFFSYPHDANAPLVERIKTDLEARGHEVWFDANQIKSGDDWRNAITRGILDSQQVVAFLSKHAVRDPGVCLNEIAIALADKGEAMVTVLVEPESEVSAPVSITHIQWLKMEDWQAQAQDDGWYRTQLDRLIDAIENPSHAGRNEELETLKLALDPMSFYAEIAPHIPGFTGRRWIIDRYTTWLTDEPNSRVLRIEGGPGLGKTAVASYLAHSTKSSVLAVHLCQYNKGESRNPLRLVRTLAYQLATRLPDYRARLLKTVAIQHPETMLGKDPASLWGELISAPLAGVGKGTIDRQRLAMIIDGLDEATVEGKNTIVELLATEINQLPKWIGVVLTGRPDPELTQRLARYQPLVLRDDDPQNIADLKVYVDVWLDQEVKAGKLTPTQANAASEALLARSQGAFLYLTQARIAVAENMLDLTQPTQFPSGLTEIYQRFFERRFPDAWNDEGRYKAKVRPLLELVLASPEPLPLSIAKEILKWGSYDGPEVIKSLGSLLKRAKGGLAGEEEETLAPFHNSVREWLQDADAAGDFHVSAEDARVPLTTVVWRRYLESQEKDAYGWQVLPDLLPLLSETQREEMLDAPNRETSLVLFRLADSLPPKLRFSEAAAMFLLFADFSLRISERDPENTEFAHDLSNAYTGVSRTQHVLGNTEAALGFYEKSLAILRRLSAAAPEAVDFSSGLAIGYSNAGSLQEDLGNTEAALDYFEQSLAICQHLSTTAPENAKFALQVSHGYRSVSHLYHTLGKTKAALDYCEKSLAIAQHLASTAPENTDFADDLSSVYGLLSKLQFAMGDIEAALSHGEKSLAIMAAAPENTDATCPLNHAYAHLGRLQTALGNTKAALDYYEKSLAISEHRLAAAPENAAFARNLASIYESLGTLHETLGNTKSALNYYEQSRVISQGLSTASPKNVNFAFDLFICFGRIGDLQYGQGNIDVAVGYYEQAHAIIQRLAVATQNDADFARNLGMSYTRLGRAHESMGEHKAALDYFEQSLAIAQRLSSSAPESAAYAYDLSQLHKILGRTQCALGNTDAALTHDTQNLTILERLSAASPQDARFARDLSVSYDRLGDMQQALGNSQSALALYQQVLEIAERLSRSAPENAQFARDLSISYDKLGNMQKALGNSQAALARYQQGLEITERLSRSAPENAQFARDLSVSYSRLGDMQQALGNSQAALARYQQDLEIIERLSRSAPENAEFACDLSVSYSRLGDMQKAQGNSSAALALYQQGLEIIERLSRNAPENAQFANNLWAICWRCATVAAGEEQMQWWRKVHSALTTMQERGILSKSDEQCIAVVKNLLGLD